MSSLFESWISLLKLIYPIQEPERTRDRPLEVLCLGLSRSGTESLSKALRQLGYDDVYHGMQVIDYRLADAPQWWRLTRAKLQGDQGFLNGKEFDKILGHCQALTDFPCCSFSTELLQAYPDAKVVLNRRSDVNAWAESFKSQLFGMYANWYTRFRRYFERELFWVGLAWLYCGEPLMVNRMRQNQPNMASEYEAHYHAIKTECQKQGRKYLEWTVEDGWEPLCKFLDKPIPQSSFPKGNTGADFQAFRKNFQGPRWRRGNRNVAIAGGVSVAVVAWAIYLACY